MGLEEFSDLPIFRLAYQSIRNNVAMNNVDD